MESFQQSRHDEPLYNESARPHTSVRLEEQQRSTGDNGREEDRSFVDRLPWYGKNEGAGAEDERSAYINFFPERDTDDLKNELPRERFQEGISDVNFC